MRTPFSGILLLVMVFVGAVAGFGWWSWHYAPGPYPPKATNTYAPISSPARQPTNAPHRITMAGSGSNLPLTRQLLRAFVKAYQPTQPFKLYRSIGSSGGIQAVLDGVIDFGLLSRPLKPHEQQPGLHLFPYARVAVVVAVHRSVPDRNISRSTLLKIYRGQQTHWSNGQRIIVLQREKGDSGHHAIARVIPEFHTVNQEAYRTNRWRVMYRDRAMQEALLNIEGAIGIFDQGAIVCQRLPIKILTFEQIHPSYETLQSGRYPFVKTLSLVSTQPPQGPTLQWVRYLYSPAGQQQIRKCGYLPHKNTNLSLRKVQR